MKLLPLVAIGALLAMPSPAAAEARYAGSEALDRIIEEAIRNDLIPGAVLLVGRRGQALHFQAYGSRAVSPEVEAMTPDTIFDAASLTKVIATAPAIMKLFEEGRIRLNDPVTEYLPEFQGGNSRITVRHLLTHFSGLRPDLDLIPAWSGYETGVRLALRDTPVADPGESFRYSDINYILLAEMVRRVSGEPFPEYVRRNFWSPLGMNETAFQPSDRSRPRIAPTEKTAGSALPLRGIVHDPTARFMGGVAGHAGVFTTAGDLARFAEMMLGLGEYGGQRVLQPLTVRKMTTPQSPANQAILRGLGWDIDSPYSGNRGELLPLGSYGHTGYTGTSLWIDPRTEVYIILLTNRVHPHNRGSITSLRGRVATAATAALGIDLPDVALTGYNETLAGAGLRRPAHRNGEVKTGLDVLAESGFATFRGKRVGLITNHTGRSRSGKRNIDLMREAGVTVAALYSPEHGFEGSADTEAISHSTDAASGVRIWSLYSGHRRRLTEEMLDGVDVLAFDIQDVGARFYTYMCTMIYAMEEAARHGIPFVVLDRPNPITGVHVEGPMLAPELKSFVGCCEVPLRHGMTLGEIARMANDRQGIGADLTVIPMAGWKRGDWFDATGLTWIDPSPNIRNLNAALLYPALAMLEYSDNYSVGRGTDSPFEQIGADWIAGRELAKHLNQRHIPGIRVYPARLRPNASRFAGRDIEGIRFVITDRDAVDIGRLGVEVAAALRQLFPGRVDWDSNLRLIGEPRVVEALRSGEHPTLIHEEAARAAAAFLKIRSRYVLRQYE